jgi:molecular chaperone DnaK
MNMRHALLIGCSNYDDQNIARLKFANEDPQKLASALKTYCGFADGDIDILASPSDTYTPATRSNIIKSLSSPKKKRPELLVIFFSGHGITSARDRRHYLLPQDVLYSRADETSISLDLVMSEALAWQAHCTLLIVDACRNIFHGGKSLEMEQPRFDPPAEIPRGIAAFFSCAPAERSYELDAVGSGLFTHAFIEALGDTGRCATINQIDKYLSYRLPILAREHNRTPQTPYTLVDPLPVADTAIISAERKLALASASRIGREIRSTKSGAQSTRAPLSAQGVLGIDFGSTYSIAAYVDDKGELQYVKNAEGKHNIRSVISFYPDMDYVIGKEINDAPTDETKCVVVKDFKRLLISNESIDVHGQSISPVTLASLLITSIHRNFEQQTGLPAPSAIAAVPANFGIAATNRLARAFHMAGIPLKRIVGEPCAGSLNLARRHDLFPATDADSSNTVVKEVLIVDVGGGTTDISLVEVAFFDGDWQFEVQAVFGDNYLGGIDYDLAIAGLLERIIHADARFPKDFTANHKSLLLSEAERAKIALGKSPFATISLGTAETSDGLEPLEISISRSEFATASEGLNKRVSACVTKAIEYLPQIVNYLHESTGKLDLVLFAGQGCKIHPLRETILELVTPTQVIDTYQENAVVSGLALQGGLLGGVVKDFLLLDAVYTGISIACVSSVDVSDEDRGRGRTPNESTVSSIDEENQHYAPLILPFSTIPQKGVQRVHIQKAGDSAMYLKVYEESIAHDLPHLIGSAVIPPGRSGSIDLWHDVDANGLILLRICESVGDPDKKGRQEGPVLARYIVNQQWTTSVEYATKKGYEQLVS